MGGLTLGSLFDGSGGFPLGGLLCGITPKWASEIEPFPIRVTTKRLPFVKHLGDISTINGAEIEPVDIITFGSPCTDMSVAGKRAGLDGSQSCLFYEAIRIVKEMRCATGGRYPRYITWENVPGAFSSNKGEDFRAVLEAICSVKNESVSVPEPPNGKWTNAGEIMADGFSIAWRVFDAQYWGVPQRRKRIYLVADFAGASAGDVLFKSEGLSGYSAESFRAWQRTAGSTADCTGATGRICLNDQGGQCMNLTEDVTCTLRAESHHPPLVLESHPADSRIKISDDGKIQTLTSRCGTGGGNVPLLLDAPKAYGICSKDSNSMKSDNPHSGFYEADTARTLDANGGNPSCNQGGVAVVSVQGSMIGRAENNGPQGSGINVGVSFTLNATDKHAVAYSTSKSSYHTFAKKEKANALVASDYKDPPILCFSEETYTTYKQSSVSPTLKASGGCYGGGSETLSTENAYIVRRLTPTECARLQGFPDWWCSDLGIANPSDDEFAFWHKVFETHRKATGKATKPKTDKQILKWLKNPHSDSAEYKMWGNGVALPNVYFVLSGIVYYSQFAELLF